MQCLSSAMLYSHKTSWNSFSVQQCAVFLWVVSVLSEREQLRLPKLRFNCDPTPYDRSRQPIQRGFYQFKWCKRQVPSPGC